MLLLRDYRENYVAVLNIHFFSTLVSHTDATDSSMFSLDPMLPMSYVQIGLTLTQRQTKLHSKY